MKFGSFSVNYIQGMTEDKIIVNLMKSIPPHLVASVYVMLSRARRRMDIRLLRPHDAGISFEDLKHLFAKKHDPHVVAWLQSLLEIPNWGGLSPAPCVFNYSKANEVRAKLDLD